MKTKLTKTTAVILGAAVILGTQPGEALAGRRGGRHCSYSSRPAHYGHGYGYRKHKRKHYTKRYRRHDHYGHDHGAVVKRLPYGAVIVKVGKVKFHYSRGVFYKKCKGEFVIVRAPKGACIRNLPHGYSILRVHGKRYYSYNETFYTHTPDGYLVVEEPAYDVAYEYDDGDHGYFRISW